MLDVCLLGTGGMMPLPYRWLTSMMARYNGQSILIDCGEGTQIAMKEKGLVVSQEQFSRAFSETANEPKQLLIRQEAERIVEEWGGKA